ncbi:MAG TPA: 1-acyl-sn-glycerol-3-phosphate acyltransferase [Candidatus Cloacimonetes bacterium]|nr:1-acyl-sn-glycerol-3-phosphate acyltransferase [Candidatus Cloacimonadota bacterium]
MKNKRITYSIITTSVRFFMKYFWHYEIIHKERIKNITNCILASNHISWFDPPFIGSIMPFEINYLAKSELFKNKIFGNFLQFVNAIPIKRGKVDRTAINRVEEKLAAGQSILLFPEGTRKSNKVKPGIGKIAIQTGKDIVPIYMKNSNKFRKCFLGKDRLKIVIGEKIKKEDYSNLDDSKNNYRYLANFIMKKIKELENEC